MVTAGGRLVALTPGAVARVTAAEGPGRYRASMVTRCATCSRGSCEMWRRSVPRTISNDLLATPSGRGARGPSRNTPAHSHTNRWHRPVTSALPLARRSLGDFSLKHPAPILSPEPALASVTLTPADRLLLVATDGVTDVVGDDDALGAALDALDKVRVLRVGGVTWEARCRRAAMPRADTSGGHCNLGHCNFVHPRPPAWAINNPQARDTTDDATALAQAAADAVVRTALAAGSSDNLTAAVMVFDWTAYDG